MTIKFMFNSPNDASLLYACTNEVGESPFGDEDTITVEIRRSKEYSETILADVKSCLSGFTEYRYLGCRERIAREAYQLTINSMTYDVFFVFDKREDDNIQLHIEIESPIIENPDFKTRYNKTLETLKLALKDRVSKDWQGCTWLIDINLKCLALISIIVFSKLKISFVPMQTRCLFNIWDRIGLIAPVWSSTRIPYAAWKLRLSRLSRNLLISIHLSYR